MAAEQQRCRALPRKRQKARGVDTEATPGGAIRSTAEVERDRATARRQRPVEYGRSAQRITSDGRWRRSDGERGVAEEATEGRGVDAEAPAGGAMRSTPEGRTRPGHGASAATGRILQVGAADHERRGRWRNDEGDGQRRQVSDGGGDGGGATAGGRCRRSNSRRGVDAEATAGAERWRRVNGGTGSSGGPTATGEPWRADGDRGTVAERRSRGDGRRFGDGGRPAGRGR